MIHPPRTTLFRRRWVTIWTDGTIDRRFFTHRSAEHREWGINNTAQIMGAESRVHVKRVDDCMIVTIPKTKGEKS